MTQRPGPGSLILFMSACFATATGHHGQFVGALVPVLVVLWAQPRRAGGGDGVVAGALLAPRRRAFTGAHPRFQAVAAAMLRL